MHVALVNQFYPPASAPTGKLLADLAMFLAEAGHRVTVITSAGAYGAVADAGRDDVNHRIAIVRLGKGAAHRQNLASKLGDYLLFFIRSSRVLRGLDPLPDVVVCMTTPPFCGLIGKKFQRSRGVPFVSWCMDLYPEALIAHGLLGTGSPIYRLLRRIARSERHRAASVISLGPDMTAILTRDTPNVTEIPVWSDLRLSAAVEDEARALRRQRGWADDELVFLYSGNMGRAHRVEEFAALARALKSQGSRFRMVFSGNGPSLERWKKSFGDLFEFISPVAGDRIAAHLLSGDVHLVSQQPQWTGVVVPSKFQAACAVGRPVVFAGPADSAVAEWIRRNDTGWVMPPGESSVTAHVAAEVMDDQARRRKADHAIRLSGGAFDRGHNCRSIVKVLERVAGIC